MQSNTIIRAEALSLGYGGRVVISRANLQIHLGELLVVLGPNGSGKSTLLKALLGIIAPLSGALVRDESQAGSAVIGYVPQRFNLTRTLPTTVREFVLLGHVGSRFSRTECLTRLPETIASVGLEGKLNESYWSLSGGQQQRALLARALLRRPRLLILDEPTVGIDIVGQRNLLILVKEFSSRDKMTTVVVTHDLEVARELASRVLLVSRQTIESLSLADLSEERVSQCFVQQEVETLC